MAVGVLCGIGFTMSIFIARWRLVRDAHMSSGRNSAFLRVNWRRWWDTVCCVRGSSVNLWQEGVIAFPKHHSGSEDAMSNINYNHLYYFWHVYQEGSVVGAAEALI
jgi:hypothetical protein